MIAHTHPAHVSPDLTGSGFAAGARWRRDGGEQRIINAPVSPDGTPGEVVIYRRQQQPWNASPCFL